MVMMSRFCGTVKVLSKDRAMTARTNAQGRSWDSPSLGEKLGCWRKNGFVLYETEGGGVASLLTASDSRGRPRLRLIPLLSEGADRGQSATA